jgi:GTPase SAR1 family protein
LVGTKYDKQEEGSVDEQKADSLREKLGYSKYLHCSAKDGTNVKRVFDSAIRAALKDKMSLMTVKGKKKDCVVY